MPPFLTKQQFQIPSSVPAIEPPHLLPQPLRRSSQQIQPSIWLGTPPDSLRPPKCHTLTAVFLRLEPQSDTATTGTAGSPAMQKLSFGPATALAGCSQIVLENQSPNDPITQSLNSLPVDFPQHDVDGSNRRHHVCQQPSFTHPPQRLHA